MKDKTNTFTIELVDVLTLNEIKGYLSALDLKQAREYSDYISTLINRAMYKLTEHKTEE